MQCDDNSNDTRKTEVDATCNDFDMYSLDSLLDKTLQTLLVGCCSTLRTQDLADKEGIEPEKPRPKYQRKSRRQPRYRTLVPTTHENTSHPRISFLPSHKRSNKHINPTSMTTRIPSPTPPLPAIHNDAPINLRLTPTRIRIRPQKIRVLLLRHPLVER
jgi:hypothetical protein